MAEKTTRQKKYESHIPEEAREHFRAARDGQVLDRRHHLA